MQYFLFIKKCEINMINIYRIIYLAEYFIS